MTIVNATSIFPKNDFKEMVEDFLESDSIFKDYVNNCLQNMDYSEGVDYSQMLKVRKNVLNKYKSTSTNINWFNSNPKN
jgi:hypothetical protein